MAAVKVESIEDLSKFLSEKDKWKLYAQAAGERLSDNGPEHYYIMTADEWWAWFLSLDVRRRLNPQRTDDGNI